MVAPARRLRVLVRFSGVVGLLGLLEQTPRVQSAGDRPGLCRRAARMVRWIAVEDLTYGAHRLVLQCVAYRLQHSLRRANVAGNAIGGEAEWSEKPTPNRPLVIAAVAFRDAAAVVRMISRTAGRQRAQPERSE